MKRRPFLLSLGALMSPLTRLLAGRITRPARAEAIAPKFRVTLPEAHKGTLAIDTKLLDSYGPPPEPLRQYYLDARAAFFENAQAGFQDAAIVDLAQNHQVPFMGGPMLGDLTAEGVTVWLRPASHAPITVRAGGQSVELRQPVPGEDSRLRLQGLQPATRYSYQVELGGTEVAQGQFTTAPQEQSPEKFRVAFGSCCHKIGVHNPNLFSQIVQRQPHVMMLLGDIAVDDRNNEINMHCADYQLRDVSTAWRHLASHVPLYASWDDHDYFDNDLSGIPKRYTDEDRDRVRAVWKQNWNNPTVPKGRKGIYFNSRVGPVEIIMLDTRSYRSGKQRRQYGSYLGDRQLEWLKQTLKDSTAPFKIISSGTMWSDYVSRAKDSWGSWDTQAREEIFGLIEQENIGGVLLVSGDRHGARAFRIPRESGHTFYEFEPATLGGVSGPAGLVKDCPEQLFGYSGQDAAGQNFVACGEFTFDMAAKDPQVTFRLITEHGHVKEQITLSLSDLTPAQGI